MSEKLSKLMEKAPSKHCDGITFVCQQLSTGGAERVFSILINYFVNRGYPVQVILLYNDRLDYSISADAEIEFLAWKKDKKLSSFLSHIKQLRGKIKYCNVISFLFLAIFYTICSTRKTDINVLVSERNDPNNDPPGLIRKAIRTLSYCFADSVVFQTNDAKEYFPGLVRKKGFIIANPIPEYQATSILVQKDKRIVSVCRLNKQKNIKMSIDAFKMLLMSYPDYYYDIYGEGELQNDIEEYIRINGLTDKVFLKGFSTNIHSEIGNSMMFVSSSDYEGISNSMLEAMAIGLPVVCTDCPIGGARQIIKNEVNGILIKMRDPEGMCTAMKRIIEDEKLRKKLSLNAVKVTEEYSVDAIGRQWESLLK